ncbi:MAG: protein kinase [Candidatus Poseidoniales archaeon]
MNDPQFPASFEELNRRFRIDRVVLHRERIKILDAFLGEERVLIHIPTESSDASNVVTLLRGLDHIGVLRFIEEIHTRNCNMFVTEWIELNSLETMLLNGMYRHTEHFTVQLLKEVAHILTYLHSLRPPIVHGAVRLENMILDNENRLVLIGFEHAHDDPYRALETARDIQMFSFSAIRLLTKLLPEEMSSLTVDDLTRMSLGRPIATLLIEGISDDPNERPTAGKFAQRLQDILWPLDANSTTVNFTQRPIRQLRDLDSSQVDAIPLSQVSVHTDLVATSAVIDQKSNTPEQTRAEPMQKIPAPIPAAYPERQEAQSPSRRRQQHLQELWDQILTTPEDEEIHTKFAKFAVESNQYKAAADLYRQFEKDAPEHRLTGEKFRGEIAMKAAARIMASQPKSAPAPQAVAGFAKWSLAGSSAGLIVAAIIKSLSLAVISGPIFAFSIWARFRRNK